MQADFAEVGPADFSEISLLVTVAGFARNRRHPRSATHRHQTTCPTCCLISFASCYLRRCSRGRCDNQCSSGKALRKSFA